MSAGNTLGHFVWGLIRNPPLVWLNDDGSVFDEEHVSRRERYHILQPSWFLTAATRRLDCGCTRRWTGRMTLYSWDCRKHMGDLREEAAS